MQRGPEKMQTSRSPAAPDPRSAEMKERLSCAAGAESNLGSFGSKLAAVPLDLSRPQKDAPARPPQAGTAHHRVMGTQLKMLCRQEAGSWHHGARRRRGSIWTRWDRPRFGEDDRAHKERNEENEGDRRPQMKRTPGPRHSVQTPGRSTLTRLEKQGR